MGCPVKASPEVLSSEPDGPEDRSQRSLATMLETQRLARSLASGFLWVLSSGLVNGSLQTDCFDPRPLTRALAERTARVGPNQPSSLGLVVVSEDAQRAQRRRGLPYKKSYQRPYEDRPPESKGSLAEALDGCRRGSRRSCARRPCGSASGKRRTGGIRKALPPRCVPLNGRRQAGVGFEKYRALARWYGKW